MLLSVSVFRLHIKNVPIIYIPDLYLVCYFRGWRGNTTVPAWWENPKWLSESRSPVLYRKCFISWLTQTEATVCINSLFWLIYNSTTYGYHHDEWCVPQTAGRGLSLQHLCCNSWIQDGEHQDVVLVVMAECDEGQQFSLCLEVCHNHGSAAAGPSWACELPLQGTRWTAVSSEWFPTKITWDLVKYLV